MGEWKMPKEFPAEVKQRKDGRFDLRVGKRRLIITKREADCILSDLQVLYYASLNDKER